MREGRREEESEGGREGRKERVLTTQFIMKPALIYDSVKNRGKNLTDRTRVNQM